MTHVTCRLTAKNRDQLRNPTLGSRVWATFTFYLLRKVVHFTVALLTPAITKDVALRVSAEIFRHSLGIQISSMGHTGEITLDRLLYPDYWFIAVIVKIRLQHNSVARVHLRQVILICSR